MAAGGEIFDVSVLGGGVAGMSSALWCADLGLSSVVIEQGTEFGGQLLQIHNRIENYPGVETENGREFRDRVLMQFEKRNISARLNTEIKQVDLREKTVITLSDETIRSKAIIIATGLRRRRLGIEGEQKFIGRGILESGAKEKEKVTGKHVVIVGGGDAALENALILAEYASKVTVIHRRDSFSARPEFLEDANNSSVIDLRRNCALLKIVGGERIESVEIKDLNTGGLTRIGADAILIRIGAIPNSELFASELTRDAFGYLIVDGRCATSMSEVYAVGDVANQTSPTIASAAGMGATAAKNIGTLLN